MSERDEVISALSSSGVGDALRWSCGSAHSRAMQDFDPSTGHDQTVLGLTAFKLFTDRQDRVFSCGRYAVESPQDGGVGIDVLSDGLDDRDIRSMPFVSPGTVVRADLNQSPGWRLGRWRWLLASFEYGEIERIPWSQKSRTKRQVASQPHPEQLALWDLASDLSEMVGDALDGDLVEDDLTTLVVAHSLDRHSGDSELYVGRPRLGRNGDSAWFWKEKLELPRRGGGGMLPGPRQPINPDPNTIPDAPVRLRPEAGKDIGRSATAG